jgi:Restriction endonuclease
MPTMPSHIFEVQPRTWQELELLVAQAFDEMGYESHRDYEVATVRGPVRIDVYALKRSTPIPTVVLCECKYWSKTVEQGVVYAFRSICGDIGAHFGLIISKVGFQSGATETRAATNIHLLNFLEFQETFFDEWKTGIFMRFVRMTDDLLPLMPMNSRYENDVSIQAKLRDVNVFEKYEVFFGTQSFRSYFIGADASFPLTLTDPRGDPNDLRQVTITSHRQYFEIAVQACADAREHFGI